MTDYYSDNSQKRRFELDVDGNIAYADYRRQDGTLFIDYVEAPEALRGTGAAGRLMENVMQTARTEQLKVIPVCGYAASWIKRHPEYNDLAG